MSKQKLAKKEKKKKKKKKQLELRSENNTCFTKKKTSQTKLIKEIFTIPTFIFG